MLDFDTRCQIVRSHLCEFKRLIRFKGNQNTIKVFIWFSLQIAYVPTCFGINRADFSASPANEIPARESHTPLTKLKNTLWWQVARHHKIDPYLLYAVALVESAKNRDLNKISPWPWALNKAGQSIIPGSKQEAAMILKQVIFDGNKHVDIGLMQINLHWHGNRVEKPEHLLNPVTNLNIGAALLAEAIHSSPDNLALGVGHYHSWQNHQAAVLYGQKVLAVADQIRAIL